MGRKPTGTVLYTGGKWYAQITLRDGSRHAVPVPPRKGGLTTREDAKKLATRLTEEYRAGNYDPQPEAAPEAPPKIPTVYEYTRDWLAGQTYTTVEDDRRRLKYLARSDLGALPITETKAKHLAAFLAWLKTQPSEQGGLLAPRSVRNVYSVVRRALAHAVLDEYLPAVPTLPRGILPEIRDKDPRARELWYYERDEVETLISSLSVPPDRRVEYALKFLTGCRHGESAALTWRDWDRARRPLSCLVVGHSVERATRTLKDTKTGVGRLVPVHPVLAAILAEWRLSGWQEVYGRAPRDTDWIVPALPPWVVDRRKSKAPEAIAPRLEEPLLPRRAWASNDGLKRDLVRLGMRTDRRQHDTRATFISLARADGADAGILHWITHGSVRGIMDVYSRLPWETLCGEVARLKIKRREIASESQVSGERSGSARND